MPGRDDIHWSPRLAPTTIRRLYESEAAGHADEALLDDVGMTLLLRCQDILDIDAARRGTIVCARCKHAGTRTLLARPDLSAVRRTEREQADVVTCPVCAWSITWREYEKSYHKRQLHIGGAGPAFRAYVAGYPTARTPQQKMILIDQLVHAFHFSLATDPTRPTRAACVNLIKGKLHEVVAFLDELTAGLNVTGPLAETHRQWRARLHALGGSQPD